jgi:hypothetical protein
MFIAKTVVVIVVLGAGGIAASSANTVDNEFSVPSGRPATAAVARPSIADEPIPTIQPASVVTASMPLARRVTAQK